MPSLSALVLAASLIGQPAAVVVVKPADTAPPGVTVSVAPGVLVALDASQSKGDQFTWDSEADPSTYRVDSSGKLLYFAAPAPGTYRFSFHATGIVDGHGQTSVSRSVVTVGSPPPSPTPNPAPTPLPPPPDPTPTPPPAPIPLSFALPAHVTLVWDSSAPAAAQKAVAPLRGSTTIATRLKGLNAVWHTLDVQSPDFAARKFAGFVATAGGTPCVVVQGTPAVPGGPSPAAVPPFKATGLGEEDIIQHIQALMGGR